MDTVKAKILIVDDNPNNLELLLQTLKNDYKIIAATSGKKALEKAQAHNPPDLILLDVMMPEMDGYEVCYQLKANPRTQDIPVIFITALQSIEDETKGLQLGAIDYIQKPFSPPIVKVRIANHLALVSAYKQLREQNQTLIEATKLKEDIERITHHDLKGPLNGILGFAQILTLSPEMEKAEYQDIAKDIESAGYQMLEMINLSLDLYKMETGSYQLNEYDLDLIPILKKVIKENQLWMNRHQIAVQIFLEGQQLQEEAFFFLQGEALLCHSLFSNLIKNALEAAPTHSIIKVFLTQHPNNAMIKIYNHGEVPQPIRNRFFEKYVSSKASGSGLGTYSAYLSATTQHGTMQLDCSEPGATTLIVQLPTSKQASSEQPSFDIHALDSSETNACLNPEIFTSIPVNLRTELYAAVESLESERVEAVIAKVALHNALLSEQLMKFANHYDYLTILTALNKT